MNGSGLSWEVWPVEADGWFAPAGGLDGGGDGAGLGDGDGAGLGDNDGGGDGGVDGEPGGSSRVMSSMRAALPSPVLGGIP